MMERLNDVIQNLWNNFSLSFLIFIVKKKIRDLIHALRDFFGNIIKWDFQRSRPNGQNISDRAGSARTLRLVEKEKITTILTEPAPQY